MHKKFIKRGNKTFGPYYYESYREGSKIKTRYLGIVPAKKGTVKIKDSDIYLAAIISIIFLSVLIFPMAKFAITGNLILDKTAYNIGEKILEFIP